MNYTINTLGQDVIAIGAPGSIARAQCEGLPFGLSRYQVTEKESGWTTQVTAKGIAQARQKAWHKGGWHQLPFTHCKPESFQVREL